MKDKIRKFIINNFLFGKGTVADEQSLFDSGLVDSFAFVVLLSFIEKEFKVRFSRSEITMDGFSSIDKIAGSIEKKLKKNK